MFDEVTKREGGKAAARRAGYVFGSTAFQVAIVLGVIVATERIKAAVVDEPVVEVKFVKRVTPPPPPPPPAPPAPPRKKTVERPPDAPKLPPPPPTALIQPKEVEAEMKAPDPNEPPEPEYDYGAGSTEGVVGGVVGATNTIEDAPAYATSGFVKPAEKERGCVGRAVRIPRDLQGIVTSVTVKFAVGRDGRPSLFEVLSDVPDKRIADAIWQAIQSCQFSAGLDPRGQPQKIWMILPLRFASG